MVIDYKKLKHFHGVQQNRNETGMDMREVDC